MRVLPVPRFTDCERCRTRAILIQSIPALGELPGLASYRCPSCYHLTPKPVPANIASRREALQKRSGLAVD